jgi:hypothetical protein
MPPAGQSPYSAADIFYTEFNGSYERKLTADQLGLQIGDNVDALDSVRQKDIPQLMKLINLTGSVVEKNVLLEWQTAVKQNSTGFNLWRVQSSRGEKCQDINPDQYTMTQLSFKPAQKSEASPKNFYSYKDTTVLAGNTYCYLLQYADSDKIVPEQLDTVISVTINANIQ